MNHQAQKDSINKEIRALRREKDVSQLDLARMLDISQSQFSLFELGYVELPEAMLGRTCKLLGTTLEDVLKGSRSRHT